MWRALGRTKKNGPDYETLMNKNRVLSAEYQVMVDTPTWYRWERVKFEVAGASEFGTPKAASRIPVSPFGLHQ